MRRSGAGGEHMQHLQTLTFAALMDRLAQHCLQAWLMPALVKREARTLPRVFKSPARKHFRHFGHIRLRVPAVHPQRVQLHQLPTVVLIEPGARLLQPLCPRI